MIPLSLSPKNQFLGSLLPSTGMKTTTASTTAKTGLSSPVVSAAPAATTPSPVIKTAPSTPKAQFVAASAGSPPSNVPPPVPSPAPTPQTVQGNVTTPSGAVVNSGTGGLVSGPPVNQDQRYGDAFEAYLRTLTPSEDETSATSFLNSLMLQQKKDQETALGRGETLGFASGEAARVNKNNAFQIEAASDALTAVTGKRSAASTAAKARLDYEKSLRDEKGEKDVTLSPGQRHYTYDPATKTYKEAAVAPEKATDPLDDEYRRAQIRNIQSEIDKRNKDSTKDSQYTIPSASRNNLLKYGLKATEVDALQQDIRDYGLSKALEGIDADTSMYITNELDKQYLAQ